MTKAQKLAYKAISIIAHPVFVFPILIALYFDLNQLPAFFAVLVLSFILPFIYFLYLYKKKEISNFDISNRKQRYKIYYATTTGLVLSLVYLYFFSTEEIFLDFGRLILLGVVLIAFNFKIKVSIHTALVTVLCFSLFQDFGANQLVFILIPIVAYSRLKLKRHKAHELILGALIPILFYVW